MHIMYKKELPKKQPMMKANLTEEELNKYLKKKENVVLKGSGPYTWI